MTDAAAVLIPLPERSERTVLWENVTQFQADIDRIRGPLLNAYQALVRSLVEAGVITPGDAVGAEHAVTITLSDHRRNRSTSLPPVQPASQ